MKFKAHIKLTDEQKDLFEWRLNKDKWEAPEYKDIEFTLKELLDAGKYDIWFSKILIPWLLVGNQPEIIEFDDANGDKIFNDVKNNMLLSLEKHETEMVKKRDEALNNELNRWMSQRGLKLVEEKQDD